MESLKRFIDLWMGRDGLWRPHDNTTMRRWVNGRWEHRPMTEDEAVDWQDRKAY